MKNFKFVLHAFLYLLCFFNTAFFIIGIAEHNKTNECVYKTRWDYVFPLKQIGCAVGDYMGDRIE